MTDEKKTFADTAREAAEALGVTRLRTGDGQTKAQALAALRRLKAFAEGGEPNEHGYEIIDRDFERVCAAIAVEEPCRSAAITPVEPKGPVKIAELKRSLVGPAVSPAVSETPNVPASSGPDVDMAFPVRECVTCGLKTVSTSTIDWCPRCKNEDGLRPRHFLTRDKKAGIP